MNENELLTACHRLGVHVAYVPYPLAGAYFHAERLIILDARLSPAEQLATLAHEYVHALCGHSCTQSSIVEHLTDRRAAHLLINPQQYASAESLHEGNLAGIADELHLPLWLVRAYQPVRPQA